MDFQDLGKFTFVRVFLRLGVPEVKYLSDSPRVTNAVMNAWDLC